MFKKILVVEDIDSIGLGLDTVLEKFHDAEIVHAKYCDEALLKMKRAHLDRAPFDLLITDLSFITDHRSTVLSNGEDLIKAVRAIEPELSIIVYSIEDRTYKIKHLLQDLDVDAFVSKGRESSGDIIRAINTIYNNGEKYISPQFSHVLKATDLVEIENYDIQLIQYLSEGLLVNEISDLFKSEGKSAKSLSSVEKRINKLRIYFRAKNNVHLVSIAKDLGLI